MPRLTSLAAVVSLAALAGCATQPSSQTAATGQPPAAVVAPDQNASAYGLFLAGQAAMSEGRGDEAAGYFALAAEKDTDAQFIKARAFQSALNAGDVPRAAALAPSVAEGPPAEEELGRLTRAVEALAEGHGRDAQTILQGPPLAAPLDRAGALLLPWAAAQAGDWKTALAPASGADDHLTGQVSQLDRALLLENRHSFGEADQTFRDLLAQSDGAGLYTAAYGAFLERRGRGAAAITLYQTALSRDPDNGLLQEALARAQAGHPPPHAPSFQEGAAAALLAPAALLLAEKQQRLGLDYLRLILRLDPHRDEAWLLVGDSMAAIGDTDAARDAYAHPQPTSPSFVAARARLIGTYDDATDAAIELQLAQETAAAAPTDPDALELLADSLRVNERYAESAQVLDKLIAQLGEKASWNLYYMRGVALDQAGDWAGAERDLKHALAISPDEPDVLNYLGYSWVDRGVDLKAAKAMIERAVAAKPDSGAIVDSLGWAYYRMGDYTHAVEQLERATELEPADPDINNHLGDAYWRAGRKLEARFQWEQVLTLQPSSKLKVEVEGKLKSGLDAQAPAAVAQQ